MIMSYKMYMLIIIAWAMQQHSQTIIYHKYLEVGLHLFDGGPCVGVGERDLLGIVGQFPTGKVQTSP